MKIARSLRISRTQLLAHKLRTVLALAGIIIGVSSVIVMSAIGRGAQQEVLGRIQAMGTNLIIVNAGQVVKSAGRNQQSGQVTTLKPADVEAIRSLSPRIVRAVGLQSRRMAVRSTYYSLQTLIVGADSDYFEQRNFSLSRGELFTSRDERAFRRVAVLGQTSARALFGSRDPIGETLRVGAVPFVVAGTLEPKGVDLNGVDQDDQIIVPLGTALRRLFNLDYLASISIDIDRVDEMKRVETMIRDLLRDRHRLSRRNLPDDFTIQNQIDLLDAEKETAETFTLLIAAIAGISLLVGGIGILAVMLIAIRERTREIGLRMAVGATRGNITVQFLLESSLLSLGGGAFGVVLGVLTALILGHFTDWNMVISWDAVVTAYLFSALMGLVFGVYPARKAASLDPIIALRSD